MGTSTMARSTATGTSAAAAATTSMSMSIGGDCKSSVRRVKLLWSFYLLLALDALELVHSWFLCFELLPVLYDTLLISVKVSSLVRGTSPRRACSLAPVLESFFSSCPLNSSVGPPENTIATYSPKPNPNSSSIIPQCHVLSAITCLRRWLLLLTLQRLAHQLGNSGPISSSKSSELFSTWCNSRSHTSSCC